MTTARLAVLLAAVLPLLAAAQERPSEDDLFGGPAAPAARPAPAPAAPSTAAPTPAPAPAPGSDDERAAALLGADRAAPDTRIEAARDNPLALGGLVYLRAATSWSRRTPPSAWPLASPSLLDAYLDARPNEQVRAFALGRLFYDPTVSSGAPNLLGLPQAGAQATRAVLDQLWINFDVGRTVFVTAGKQHVKWGTGKLWNPTDYLHPVRRDPLSQYDDRTGVTMVKAHLPWEKRGWNLYGVALLEDLAGGHQADGTVRTVDRLGDVGLGGRAEVVLGSAELAADVVAQRGHRARAGLDGSVPLGELDLHFELALRAGKDAPRWEAVPGVASSAPVLDRYRLAGFDHLAPAAVVGAEWSCKYSDEDSLTVGAEYAYDAAGYASATVYPFLLAAPLVPGTPDQRLAFTPFYLARQYAGAYLVLPAPGRWNDTTFTLSALASLTDGSAVIRLDHSVIVNTYLRVETYLAGHAGHLGGEFRFGGTIPPQNVGGGITTPETVVAPPVLDLGVALRVKL